LRSSYDGFQLILKNCNNVLHKD